MLLSKPLSTILLVYFDQLLTHPLRTKALTNSALALAANNISKYLCEQAFSNRRSNIAYALYGLIFGGSIQYYLKQMLRHVFALKDVRLGRFPRYLIERCLQTPINLCLALYFLSRFEMESHRTALSNLDQLYWPLLKTNWQYLSLLGILNMYYIPFVMQPFTAGCIYYCWLVYIAYRRRQMQKANKKDNTIRRYQEEFA